jgi:hypothetical protein
MDYNLIIEFINNESFSLQIRLDILDVYLAIRNSSRIICRPRDEIRNAIGYLLKFELQFAIAKGYVPLSNSKICFTDNFHQLNEMMDKGIPLYISKRKDEADLLRMADEEGNDSKVGNLLSYPDCCVQYIIKRRNVPSLLDSMNYLVADNKFNIWCWPAAAIADASLLPHFPCSFNCEFTEALAKTRYAYISKYGSSDLLEKVRKYHAFNYCIEENEIKVKSNTCSACIVPKQSIYEF